MIPGYIVFVIFFAVLYASTNENRQLAATASALRELWSGGCRVACRRSECSGLSGLSGLGSAVPGTSTAPENSPHCACDLCPCVLIDNVMRRWEPATAAYNTAVDTLSEFYYSILKTFAELYLAVQNALECGVSCQQPHRILNLNTLDSDENFNFDVSSVREKGVADQNINEKEKTIHKIKKKLPSFSRSDMNVPKMGLENTKSVTSLKSAKENISGVIKQAVKEIKLDKKKSLDLKAKTSNDSVVDAQPSTSTSSGHCPRCVDKGKMCLGACPKANVDDNK